MTTVATVCYAFIGPILADGITSPDAGPTWTLAAACAAFLAAMTWAIRNIVVWSRDGAGVFYGEIVKPIAAAHRDLLSTLKETREKDSEALEQLAADMQKLNQTIRCRHEP